MAYNTFHMSQITVGIVIVSQIFKLLVAFGARKQLDCGLV